jgi:hypothetical protein
VLAGLEGAVLELDGDSKELRAFIDGRTEKRPDLAEANRRRIAVLRDMLERHADPEIAIELSVRDDEGYLVEAPDVGDNPIWVGRRLPEQAVEALRAALGDGLRPSTS